MSVFSLYYFGPSSDIYAKNRYAKGKSLTNANIS